MYLRKISGVEFTALRGTSDYTVMKSLAYSHAQALSKDLKQVKHVPGMPNFTLNGFVLESRQTPLCPAFSPGFQ